MKALIEPSGRIAEICVDTFPVHPDLVWVDVADDTTASDTYVDGAVIKFICPEVIPQKTLVEQILANPADLAELKTALGIA
jgi:hypothetical protein